MGFQSLTQTEPKQNPLVPVTCYLSISPHAVAQLLKKIGLLSAADVTYLTRRSQAND